MCVGQLFHPYLIYGFFRFIHSLCFIFRKSRQTIKKEIIGQFGHELTAFETRYLSNNLPHFEYSEEAKSELADIQQQLEKAVDKLAMKQRKSKRKRKEAAAGCARVTFYYDSFTLWFWMAYFAMSYWFGLSTMLTYFKYLTVLQLHG